MLGAAKDNKDTHPRTHTHGNTRHPRNVDKRAAHLIENETHTHTVLVGAEGGTGAVQGVSRACGFKVVRGGCVARK